MKMLRMVCALYMPMEENETQEQAEDRTLERIEDAGMEVYSWWNAETVDVVDGERRRSDERIAEIKTDSVNQRKTY